MTLPFTLPDWMPWWLQLLVVVAAILAGLTLLAMPFSVFGLKSRLDTLEARLDDIHADIRTLTQRLPEPTRTPYDPPAILRAATTPPREILPPPPAPIPPATWEAEPPPRELRSPTLRAAARLGDAARERAEPRLGRPR